MTVCTKERGVEGGLKIEFACPFGDCLYQAVGRFQQVVACGLFEDSLVRLFSKDSKPKILSGKDAY